MKSTKHILFIVLLLIIVGCNSSTKVDDKVTVKEIVPVKADDISDIVESFSGDKAVLLNVWATWCVPCVEEIPYIVRVRNEFSDDMEVVFISADFPEEIDRIHGFLKDQGVYWQTYLKDDRDEPFIDAVWPKWSGAIPATVVYNKDGTALTFFERPATYDEFRDLAITAISNN